MLIGAGLRIGEAIALEWRDIDRDGNAVRISRAAKDGGEIGTPKGDRSRTVLLAPYFSTFCVSTAPIRPASAASPSWSSGAPKV